MKQVIVDRREGVAVLTLNDPERRNALNLALNAELIDAMDALESDPAVGAIVVTGTAPAFCAGANLGELGDSRREGLEAIYEGFLRVAKTPVPTIAAVNGAAVGAGVNLALACDLRLAARSARFDTRFLQLAIHPGGGHAWMMQRAVGPQGTAATVLFGEVLDGPEAERVGIVWRCVEDSELLDTAVSMAGHAARAPRELVRRVKATIATAAATTTHEQAIAGELDDQVWSMDQPAFAKRLAALQSRIRSDA